jgi:hypothetical protein
MTGNVFKGENANTRDFKTFCKHCYKGIAADRPRAAVLHAHRRAAAAGAAPTTELTSSNVSSLMTWHRNTTKRAAMMMTVISCRQAADAAKASIWNWKRLW